MTKRVHDKPEQPEPTKLRTPRDEQAKVAVVQGRVEQEEEKPKALRHELFALFRKHLRARLANAGRLAKRRERSAERLLGRVPLIGKPFARRLHSLTH